MNAAIQTTSPHPQVPSPVTPLSTCSPSDVSAWLKRGEAVLIDVRQPDEHARESIPGSTLIPLARIDSAALPAAPGLRVIVHCKSGRRSAEAVARLSQRGVPAVSMAGGIDAWTAAALPVKRNQALPIPIMRQVQVVVGVLLLISTAAAWWLSPMFIVVPGLLGAGLLFAGVSGICGLASLLSFMPWNRGFRLAGHAVNAQLCACGPACGPSCSCNVPLH